MAKVSEIIDPYFSHDFYSRQDKKHILLIDKMGYEGYGLFWAIVEFMHYNELRVGEERLIAGKDYAEKVRQVLNDFKLFRVEGDEYISDRILRNINKQTEKSKKASAAINARWAMSALKSAHIEVFGMEPILSDEEVRKFLNYSNKIPDLKDRLCDLLYTTQKLKFENKPDFKGSINWLLKDTYLTQMLHGGFGEIKSWQAHKDFIAKKEKEQRANEQRMKALAYPFNASAATKGLTDFDIDTIDSKSVAEELVLAHSNFDAVKKQFIVEPAYSGLIDKFDLSRKDLRKKKLKEISNEQQ